MSTRLSVAELARRYKISPTRVYQLLAVGLLTKGKDRKIDLAEADRWREASMLKHPAQTLTTANSNGFFISAPKGAPVDLDAEFDAALLADAPAPPEPPRAPTPGAQTARSQAEEINALRMRKLQGEIDLAQHKRQREAGLLIEKSTVRDQGIEAGKIVTSLLNALPTEIAGIFADPERRSEVRAKVQERVDQMIYALHAAVAAAEAANG